MVSTEEIVERSIYMNILAVALKSGYTLDPEDYLDINGLPTVETEKKWESDKQKLSKYIYIFGIGNSHERGIKEVPRITLELQGYYPGNIGMERFQIDDTVKDNPKMLDTGYNTKDIVIDVHLVTKTQSDMRLLHSILYKAIPTQGYIKPYYNNKEEFMKGGLLKSENLYVEFGNYYEHPDPDHGLLEHTYQINISDGVIGDSVVDMDLVPIRDISCIIQSPNIQSSTTINIKGYPTLSKIDDYLYKADYLDTDYEYAKHFMKVKYKPTASGCSSIRSGNIYGRNFDYPYDERVYFIVNIPKSEDGRLSSMGVAGGLSTLTKDTIGINKDDYKIIPFITLDGINEAGVVCSVNVVPTGDKGITTGTIPKIEERDNICSMMVVRYILDHFSTAKSAVEYLDNYVSIYAPNTENMGQEVHIMVADSTNTYVIEFINNTLNIVKVNDRSWITNFYITGVTFEKNNTIKIPYYRLQYGLTPFSQGLERWNIIANNHSKSNTISGMRSLLNDLRYTKAYEGDMWKTEFTGDWTPYGYNIFYVYNSASKNKDLLEWIRSKYINRTRDGKTWQTVHSSIYDMSNKTLHIINQEGVIERVFEL